MATKTIDRSPSTVPTSGRAYKDDLFGWIEDQVALLNAGRVSEIDFVNISDELGDVGNEQYLTIESAIRLILHHLLKWDHQPERRSRSWVGTIKEQRRHIVRILKKNPSLKSHISEAIAEGYEDAVTAASVETGIPENVFLSDCPYSWDEVQNRLIVLDDLQSPNAR